MTLKDKFKERGKNLPDADQNFNSQEAFDFLSAHVNEIYARINLIASVVDQLREKKDE